MGKPPNPISAGLPSGSAVRNPPADAGDVGLISESERSPGGGNGNPLQYSCLKNPMDRGAWQATQSQGSQRVKHDWAKHGAQALSSIHTAIEQENRYWLSVVGMLLH